MTNINKIPSEIYWESLV